MRHAALASALALALAARSPRAGADAAGPGAGMANPADRGSGSPRVLDLAVQAGAPEVSAAASPAVARLGGHFTLYITATFGEGVEVNLREPMDLGPAFEIRRRLSEDRDRAAGGKTREWQIDVTPWELGELQLAPIAVTFTASGRAGQVQTNAVPMKIVGVLGDVVDDPTLMRGLAPPAGLTRPDWFWIWLATAAGAAIGVLAGALWLRRRRGRRALPWVGAAIARPRRIAMTGERALERLLAIEQSGVLEQDRERKRGYAEMVEAIRDYLAARYQIAVHELTSSELLGRLDRLATPEEVGLIAAWLDDCDPVKYGGQRRTPDEAGEALDGARALIAATTEPRTARWSAANGAA